MDRVCSHLERLPTIWPSLMGCSSKVQHEASVRYCGSVLDVTPEIRTARLQLFYPRKRIYRRRETCSSRETVAGQETSVRSFTLEIDFVSLQKAISIETLIGSRISTTIYTPESIGYDSFSVNSWRVAEIMSVLPVHNFLSRDILTR